MKKDKLSIRQEASNGNVSSSSNELSDNVSGNGIGLNNKALNTTCKLCNVQVAPGDRYGISVKKKSNESEQFHFHLICPVGKGFDLNKKLFSDFQTISSNKRLDPLFLSDKEFKELCGLFNSLQSIGTGNHEVAKRETRSMLILQKIIHLQEKNLLEEENLRIQLQNLSQSEDIPQGHGGLGIAALVQ